MTTKRRIVIAGLAFIHTPIELASSTVQTPAMTFDFAGTGTSLPPEHYALQAYGERLVAKYGPRFRTNAVEPTPDEAAEIDRLNRELSEAHERAFLAYHRERVSDPRRGLPYPPTAP